MWLPVQRQSRDGQRRILKRTKRGEKEGWLLTELHRIQRGYIAAKRLHREDSDFVSDIPKPFFRQLYDRSQDYVLAPRSQATYPETTFASRQYNNSHLPGGNFMMGRGCFSVHDWQRPELVSRGLVGRKTFSAQDFPWKVCVRGSCLCSCVFG